MGRTHRQAHRKKILGFLGMPPPRQLDCKAAPLADRGRFALESIREIAGMAVEWFANTRWHRSIRILWNGCFDQHLMRGGGISRRAIQSSPTAKEIVTK